MAIHRTDTSIVYTGWDRIDVECWIDGQWRAGELRSWQKIDGAWSAIVTYTRTPGETHIGRFSEDDVRKA